MPVYRAFRHFLSLPVMDVSVGQTETWFWLDKKGRLSPKFLAIILRRPRLPITKVVYYYILLKIKVLKAAMQADE